MPGWRRRSAKEIKRRILRIFKDNGVSINGMIGKVAPGWTHRILAEGNCLVDRGRSIDAYLKALEEKVKQLSPEAKRAVEDDPHSFATESLINLV